MLYKRKKLVKNKQGKIVACLYIKEDGNLVDDSWFCPNGWPPAKESASV